MREPPWNIILYPALAEGLSDPQKEFLLILGERIPELDQHAFRQALLHRLSLEQIAEAAAGLPDQVKRHLYFLAKRIAVIDGFSEADKKALAELQSAFDIEIEETEALSGPDEDAEEQDYQAIRSKYCLIAAACSFIPLPLVTDAFILVPIQAAMVEKIANLYEYRLHPTEFIKMVIERAGAEYASATVGKMAVSLIPILGWLAAAGITYATTYAIALIAREYIARDGELERSTIQALYRQAYVEGLQEFESEKEKLIKEKDILIEKAKRIADSNERVRELKDRLEKAPLVQKVEKRLF